MAHVREDEWLELVIGKDGDMNCPMCGAEVRVVGEGTLSYEPVAEARVAELEAGIREVMINIRVRSHHGADAPLLIANALELLLERGEG